MSKLRRSFKLEEKLRILREAEQQGVKAVLNRYQLSYSVLFRWREKFAVLNQLAINQLDNPAQQELRVLLEENARLKKIIAEQALLLEINKEHLLNNQGFKRT